jgi:hypothetical protein
MPLTFGHLAMWRIKEAQMKKRISETKEVKNLIDSY